MEFTGETHNFLVSRIQDKILSMLLQLEDFFWY